MTADHLATVAKVMQGIRGSLDQHAADCCRRVSGIVLSEFDHQRLSVAELWALPVLASEEVPDGHVRVLCERFGILVPTVETFEDLDSLWRSQPPLCGEI